MRFGNFHSTLSGRGVLNRAMVPGLATLLLGLPRVVCAQASVSEQDEVPVSSVEPAGSEAAATEGEQPPAEPVDCAGAYESAQTERRDGHLKAAREHAKTCSQERCNPAIVAECIELYETIGKEIPSIVLAARQAGGGYLAEVSVEMDGEPIVERLDGKPVELDPGMHQLRFSVPGREPIELSHVALVGDRNRVVEVVFGEAEAPPTSAPSDPGLPPPAATPEDRGIPLASYILAGASVVSFGAFAYLRITGIQDHDELESSCSPGCDPEEVDEIRDKFTYSYYAAGLGAATLAAATIVYFTVSGPSDDAEAKIGLAPTRSGASAVFRARF